MMMASMQIWPLLAYWQLMPAPSLVIGSLRALARPQALQGIVRLDQAVAIVRIPALFAKVHRRRDHGLTDLGVGQIRIGAPQQRRHA